MLRQWIIDCQCWGRIAMLIHNSAGQVLLVTMHRIIFLNCLDSVYPGVFNLSGHIRLLCYAVPVWQSFLKECEHNSCVPLAMLRIHPSLLLCSSLCVCGRLYSSVCCWVHHHGDAWPMYLDGRRWVLPWGVFTCFIRMCMYIMYFRESRNVCFRTPWCTCVGMSKSLWTIGTRHDTQVPHGYVQQGVEKKTELSYNALPTDCSKTHGLISHLVARHAAPA